MHGWAVIFVKENLLKWSLISEQLRATGHQSCFWNMKSLLEPKWSGASRVPSGLLSSRDKVAFHLLQTWISIVPDPYKGSDESDPTGASLAPWRGFFLKIYLLTLESEKNGERQREREREICFSTYLYIHLLILVCALTGDRTNNLVYLDDTLSNWVLAGTKVISFCWMSKLCSITQV